MRPPTTAVSGRRSTRPHPFGLNLLTRTDGRVLQYLSVPRSAQGAERVPHLAGEQVRLFPGGEVAAPVEPLVVQEVAGVGPLGPAAGGPGIARRGRCPSRRG